MGARTYTPAQAAERREDLLRSLDDEAALTARVLEALPEDRLDYRVHAKARSLRELAWHVARARAWFVSGLVRKDFQAADSEGDAPATAAEIARTFRDQWKEWRPRAAAMRPEDLAQSVDFFGIAKDSNVHYLHWCLVHEIHHRGQLSTYLRAMGARVPGVYGPSADES
jgi:uncharacterized damage-inducible protein DinB